MSHKSWADAEWMQFKRHWKEVKLTVDKVAQDSTITGSAYPSLDHLSTCQNINISILYETFLMREFNGLVAIVFVLKLRIPCCCFQLHYYYWHKPTLVTRAVVTDAACGFGGWWPVHGFSVYLPAVAPVGAQRPHWQESLQERNSAGDQFGQEQTRRRGVHGIRKGWRKWGKLRCCWQGFSSALQ